MNILKQQKINFLKTLVCYAKSNNYLMSESLKSIYFSNIPSYFNYANITWARTNPSKLRKTHYLQKQAAQIMFNKDQLCHIQPLLKNLNALNVYQIRLYQNLNFMHRIKMENIHKVFHETIKTPNHA